MSERILAVRAQELRRRFGQRPFLGLPAEEIERHFGAIEVLALDRKSDPTHSRLVVWTVVHHNYSWLTFSGSGSHPRMPPSLRSMGVGGCIEAGANEELFLDDGWQKTARGELDSRFSFHEEYDLRLAGLLQDDSDPITQQHVGLVYVARLRHPGVARAPEGLGDVSFHGIADLRQTRDQLDRWSQILIDNIDAL